MSMTTFSFVGGLLSAGYAVAGVFFLSFWRRTRDSLFAVFAVAFWLMALSSPPTKLKVVMLIARPPR